MLTEWSDQWRFISKIIISNLKGYESQSVYDDVYSHLTKLFLVNYRRPLRYSLYNFYLLFLLTKTIKNVIVGQGRLLDILQYFA